MADRHRVKSPDSSLRNSISPAHFDPHLKFRSNRSGHVIASLTVHSNTPVQIQLPLTVRAKSAGQLDRSLSVRSVKSGKTDPPLSVRSAASERLNQSFPSHSNVNGGPKSALSTRSKTSKRQNLSLSFSSDTKAGLDPPLSARSDSSGRLHRSLSPRSRGNSVKEHPISPRSRTPGKIHPSSGHTLHSLSPRSNTPHHFIFPVTVGQNGHTKNSDAKRTKSPVQYKTSSKPKVENKDHTLPNFNILKEMCHTKGLLYEDPEFPADGSSINMDIRNTGHIVWKRPHEISSSPTLIASGTPKLDILQGKAGRSWVTSSLVSLTMAPNLVRQCIPDDQEFNDKYAGIFHFKFWRFGEWIDVVIDDRLPTVNGELIFLQSADSNVFWPALFEKAYAKLYGSYGNIQGRYMKWALQDITGGIVDAYHIYDNTSMSKNILDVCMTKASLLGASISTTMTSGQRKQLSNGLMSGYIYSITGYAEIPVRNGSLILLRLRNPFGNFEWNGAWSEGSPHWKALSKELIEKLTQRKLEKGEFWMSFVDFSNIFTMIEVCHLTPESWKNEPNLQHRSMWCAAVGPRQWRKGYNAGGPSISPVVSYNCQFYLELPKQCHVIVSVLQKYRNKTENTCSLSCGCLIYHAPKNTYSRLDSTHFSKRNFCTSTSFMRERENVGFFTLPAGCYVILPSTAHAGEEGKFIIRIFVSDQVTIRELDDKDQFMDVQHDIFIDPEVLFTLHRKFVSFTNKDEELDPLGLQKLLLTKPTSKIHLPCLSLGEEGLQFTPVQLSIETCKYGIAIADKDMNGKLNTEEFQDFLIKIIYWQSVFHNLSDGKDTLDTYCLRNALKLIGFNVSNKTLEALVIRNQSKEILTLQGFINCVIKLSLVHQKYLSISKERIDKDGKMLSEMLISTIYS